MNKLLMKIANDNKLSVGILVAGAALSVVSQVLAYTGLYYTALHRGVSIRDEYYYEEECKAYKEA